MYQTAGDVPGHPEKKHQDWFDEHDKHLKKPLKARNTSGQCNTKSKKKKIQRQISTLEKQSPTCGKKIKKKKKTRGTPNCSRHEGHENILQSSDGNLHVWPQTKRIDTAKGSER